MNPGILKILKKSVPQWGLLLLLFILQTSFSHPQLQAEEDKNHPRYTFEELEVLALDHNPEVRAAFRQWRAAVAQITVSRSLPDPKISYTEFIEEVQTRVGPQRRKFALKQMFPWFGTLDLRKDAAAAKAALIEQKLESIKWKVLRNLRVTLYEMILLEEKIKINGEHLKILQDLEDSQKGRMKSGKGSLSILLRVQVERDKLSDIVATLHAMRLPLRRKSEAALGMSLSKKVPEALPPTTNIPDLKKLELDFRKNNPQWLGNKRAQDMAQAGVSLAIKKAKPDFGVGLTWVDTGPSSKAGTAGSGDDPLAISLSFSLPIWRDKVNSNIDQAQEKLGAVQIKELSLLDRFHSDVEWILFRIKDADRKCELYGKKLIPKATDAYIASRKAHEAGQVSFQSILDAERLVLRFSLDYKIALTDRAKGNADLEQKIGSSILTNTQE